MEVSPVHLRASCATACGRDEDRWIALVAEVPLIKIVKLALAGVGG